MATAKDPQTRVYDGFASLEGGMDGGRSPSVIDPNQVGFAQNSTMRGGFISSRPGIKPIVMQFNGDGYTQNLATTGLFQGAFSYLTNQGNTELVWGMSGRLFRLQLAFANAVSDISPTPANSPTIPIWHFVQADQYLIVSDGYAVPGCSTPSFYNGATTLRCGVGMLPASGPMAYGQSRVFLSQGTAWLAGDVWKGPSGTVANQFRDSILHVTENTYLAGGGSFNVPSQSGDITSLRFMANLDTSLGDGDMLIMTRNGAFSASIPTDRSTWNNLGPAGNGMPLQRVSLLKYGSMSDRSVINHNSDAYFRSQDGIRSFKYAQRQFEQPGQLPLSGEVQDILDFDPAFLLDYSNGVIFDNRLLMSTAPHQTTMGVVHKGFVAMDFSLNNSLRDPLSPAWEGLWTLGDVLQVITAWVNSQERCFAFVRGTDGTLQIWELTRDEWFDDGDVPIYWTFETRSMPCTSPLALKRLETGDWWYNDIRGSVFFQAYWKPDYHPCWTPWANWRECAPNLDCGLGPGVCKTLHAYRPQYRTRVSMPQPPDVQEPTTQRWMRDGFEFQVRLEITGPAMIMKHRIQARLIPELEFGEPTSNGVCQGAPNNPVTV